MPRQATHAEIRAYLGHGEGSRVVKIGRDGHVTYHGIKIDTDRSHDYWHEAGQVDDYLVEDGGPHEGKVYVARSPGRPLSGGQRRQRYNVMLEPRLKAKAEEIGGGNFSAGVARAVEEFSDNQTGK